MRAVLFVTFLVFLLFSSRSSFAQNDENRIRSLLEAQVRQWNKGRIEGYMIGYWESDSLVFLGKDGPTYGFAAAVDRYRKAYPDTEAMGELTSTILRIQLLCPEYAYITGRWSLNRKAGAKSGSYTLLMRKIDGNWVIIEDHSS